MPNFITTVLHANMQSKKEGKTPNSSTKTKNNDLEGALVEGYLRACDKVFCDQYMLSIKGKGDWNIQKD